MYKKHGDTISVIIYAKHTIHDIRDCIVENYGRIKYELPFINAFSVELPKEKISIVSNHKMVSLIRQDAIVSKTPVYASMPPLSKILESCACSEEVTVDEFERGKGVSVAVIDTGINPHYDLIKPVNRIVGFKDFVGQKNVPYDDDGHGTHVAGIIAGNGYASKKYMGTAPCANLVIIKALDHQGNGTESDILAAMQWVLDNRKYYNIKVINLSLGIKAEEPYKDDPLVRGANAAVAHGLTVVTAAGNNGPGECTINSPGVSPYVITVGAADLSHCQRVSDISIARFSSRGPTRNGESKPDLVAPGVDIISLDSRNPKGYSSQSGTSMAAPVVSGAAACLYSKYPNLTPFQVKQILTRDTLPIEKENRYAQGYGLLNYKIFLDL